MAPIAYTGALQPKKKSELQDIALALHISDQGTNAELQSRIKKHLDANPSLEDDPQFAGLYGRRRKGSAQPSIAPSNTSSEKPRSSTRVANTRDRTPHKEALETVPESPEQVSQEQSNALSTPQKSPRQAVLDFTTPSSLPPLPVTPSVGLPSPAKTIIEHLPTPAQISVVVQRFHKEEVVPHGAELLDATRTFLSNSRNIWSLTALLELLSILSTVIPWQYAQVPLSSKGGLINPVLHLPYPPLSTFQTSAFWLVLLHWALPTLVAPAVVGNLISFNPQLRAKSTSSSSSGAATSGGRRGRSASNAAAPTPQEGGPTAQPAPFDTLTASIVRLAASIAYPYTSLSVTGGVGGAGLDVLGYNVRVFNASLGLAFALAEAIQGAPGAVVRVLEDSGSLGEKKGAADDREESERRVVVAGSSARRSTRGLRREVTERGEEQEQGESSEVD